MPATASPPPDEYGDVLADLQHQIQAAQLAAVQAANREMLSLYREIGRVLLAGAEHGWPADAIQRMGADLRARFPGADTFSPGNLRWMQRFAQAWPDPAATPELDALPQGHFRLLLDKVSDAGVRDRDAAAAVRYGWSHDVLLHQILARTQHPAPNRDRVRVRVQVDFHLSPDGPTLASTSGVYPPVELSTGNLMEAYDGDIARLAVIDFIDGDVLSLMVLPEDPGTSPCRLRADSTGHAADSDRTTG